jgi:hypothetical protein
LSAKNPAPRAPRSPSRHQFTPRIAKPGVQEGHLAIFRGDQAVGDREYLLPFPILPPSHLLPRIFYLPRPRREKIGKRSGVKDTRIVITGHDSEALTPAAI